MLKIAVQKSGRLSEGSIQLLKDTGLQFNNGRKQLLATASNFPVEILYLRDDDIPQYVQDGVADLGIVGENTLMETGKSVKVIRQLGFSKCRLSLAIPKADHYTGPEYFAGKRIATSYVNILQDFLTSNDLTAEIHPISGSVEIAPGIGLADAVMDIVSTGSTLISNGLKEVEVVTRSEAVLIAHKAISDEKQKILDQLAFRINAVLTARGYKYILLNAPNDKIDEIIAVLPGMKSPTVLPLADKGWSSVHSVVEEKQLWEVIDKLKMKGAQGLLIIPIEKMVV